MMMMMSVRIVNDYLVVSAGRHMLNIVVIYRNHVPTRGRTFQLAPETLGDLSKYQYLCPSSRDTMIKKQMFERNTVSGKTGLGSNEEILGQG